MSMWKWRKGENVCACVCIWVSDLQIFTVANKKLLSWSESRPIFQYDTHWPQKTKLKVVWESVCMCAYRAGRPWGETRRGWLSETGHSDNEPRRPAGEWRRGGGKKEREKRGMRKTVATLTLPVTPDPGLLCVLSARLSGRFVRPPCSMATPLTDTLYILWVRRELERGRGEARQLYERCQ